VFCFFVLPYGFKVINCIMRNNICLPYFSIMFCIICVVMTLCQFIFVILEFYLVEFFRPGLRLWQCFLIYVQNNLNNLYNHLDFKSLQRRWISLFQSLRGGWMVIEIIILKVNM